MPYFKGSIWIYLKKFESGLNEVDYLNPYKSEERDFIDMFFKILKDFF